MNPCVANTIREEHAVYLGRLFEAAMTAGGLVASVSKHLPRPLGLAYWGRALQGPSFRMNRHLRASPLKAGGTSITAFGFETDHLRTVLGHPDVTVASRNGF